MLKSNLQYSFSLTYKLGHRQGILKTGQFKRFRAREKRITEKNLSPTPGTGPPRTPPMKLDYLGHEYRNFNFEMADVEVRSSCLAELNGEHYVFGGDSSHTLQMAKFDGCGLKRMPDLPFTFSQGTCGTYQWTKDTKRKGHTKKGHCSAIQV